MNNEKIKEKMVINAKQICGKIITYFNIEQTPYIKFLKDYFGNKPLVLCEVGVNIGNNVIRMLKNLNVSRIYLVDLWGKMTYEEGRRAGETVEWSESYEIAKKNLKPFDDKVVFIRDYSYKAVDRINEKLDALYIDANHDYSTVLIDLKAYYPLVKKGGIIGGHDWCPRYPGVSRAVNEFFNYPKMVCENNERTEWWIIKKTY